MASTSQRPLVQQTLIDLMQQARAFEETERDQALAMLRSLDPHSLKAGLSDILNNQSEDVTARADAARILVRFYSHEGVSLIIQHLDDADDVMRWSICNTLGKYTDVGNQQAIAALVKILQHDPDGETRLTAVHFLGRIGDTQTIPVLEHAQQHDKGVGREGHEVAEFATQAIQRIQERQNDNEPQHHVV